MRTATDPSTRPHSRTRRTALMALVLAAGIALTACGGGGSATSTAAGTFASGNADYDAVINAGPVASADAVNGNAWAKAIKEAGVLRVGGTQTSQLFSLMNPATNTVIGFDSGLSQLLSRYILGEVKTDLTIVQSATREEVITSKAVDVVVATYSILPARMEKIDFAGPYYASQAGILVKADNDTIKGVDDLNGKQVATQAGSSGVAILQEAAPGATIVELPDDAQCVAAVETGQVDAYVIDQALLLSGLLTNQNTKIVGQPFGPVDAYGIGVFKGSEGKAFINQFLKDIVADGTWEKLWKVTIQARTGVDQVATPPEIGSAGN